ncbi:MAG TPA: DNA repair protein RecN [Lachnospiraceae bacterium]|nr:DNA repair protein RecN [Lachnospiraceae bacterium]
MLLDLHVKNLALIEETEVEFTPGLNILTGETGAGKSILIGSVNLALGAKADTDLIRHGADYALVELTFTGEDNRLVQKLKNMELPCDDGVITISRRIQPGRSVSRINGETVSAKQIKEISELLLDIHGQHEHQSLLRKKKHQEILDAYAGELVFSALAEVKSLYQERNRIREAISSMEMDETSRNRELNLLRFELQEIEEAKPFIGEDEALESKYRKMVNSQKIEETLGICYRLTGSEEEAAGIQIGRAYRELNSVSSFDEELSEMSSQLAEIESLLSDFNRELSAYIDGLEFDGEDFKATEERLNLLNHLKEKYGRTMQDVLAYSTEVADKINKLDDYEQLFAQLKNQYDKVNEELKKQCEKLSVLRKERAKELTEILIKALEELNFLTVQFTVKIEKKEISSDGFDDIEFLISTNPGEDMKPLGMVASGGELSRIMLAIKTVLAEKDAVDTLIFDEIDAGISGRTAWKVSEKLATLSRAHQVICITHLPQIAAMADSHFSIEKETDGNSTVTGIRKLNEQGMLEELARLLGADSLSQAALNNALEMKSQATKIK